MTADQIAHKTGHTITTDEEHRIMLIQRQPEAKVVQFYGSIESWKWAVGWAYRIVSNAMERRFTAANASYRLSPGLFRIPLEEWS